MGLPFVLTAAPAVAKFATPFLTNAGILAGGGAIAGQLGTKIPGVSEALGLDPKSVAEGETYDYVNDKIKGWDTGDRIRNIFGGPSEADALEAKRTQVMNTLNNSTQSLREKLQQRATQLGMELDPEDLKYQIGGGKTKETYNQSLEDLKARIGQMETLKAIPGASLEGLNLDSSPATVAAAIDDAREGLRVQREEEANNRRVAREKDDPGSARNIAAANQKEVQDMRRERQENAQYDREYRRWK